MKIPASSPPSLLSPVLFIGEDGLPRILGQVDGTATGLNAIGLAIIEAGFTGVRGSAVAGKNILWQVQIDFPEGAFFAFLCDAAQRGHPLPSVEQVLVIISPLLVSQDGRQK